MEERGALLVPPFDDDAVIAGQGTLALELLEDAGGLDVIVTPCGGAGLLSGVAIAAKGVDRSIRLFGVEPEDGNDWFLSFQASAKCTAWTFSLPARSAIVRASLSTR